MKELSKKQILFLIQFYIIASFTGVAIGCYKCEFGTELLCRLSFVGYIFPGLLTYIFLKMMRVGKFFI